LGGNRREQTSLRGLQHRPELTEVIACVEKLKGEPWEAFRDRYGDWGRDLVLYVGRHGCALKLRELASAVGGIDYVSVGAAVKRFAGRLRTDSGLAHRLRQVHQALRM
jgi:hypothetical protein